MKSNWLFQKQNAYTFVLESLSLMKFCSTGTVLTQLSSLNGNNKTWQLLLDCPSGYEQICFFLGRLGSEESVAN